MKENRMDAITDILKERVGGVITEAHKQFKGTNPYRQQPVTPQEKILRYEEIMGNPIMVQSLRQNMGESFGNYVVEMESLKRKVQNARLV